MKIALVRRRFAASGGAELYLQRLLTALAARRHDVHLYAEAWAEPPEGVTLHPVESKAGRAQRAVAFAHSVENALEKETFDVVFSLERTLRQDVYRAGDGVHAAWLDQRRTFTPRWRRWMIGLGAFHRNLLRLERSLFDPARTGRVIVNSDMVRREIRERFDYPEDRLHLIRNGVDVDRIRRGRRTESRKALGIGEDEFLILFVGSGWERKGLKYLLRAVRGLGPRGRSEPGSWHDNMLSGMQQELRLDTGFLQEARLRVMVAGKGKTPTAPMPHVQYAGELKAVEQAYAAADVFVLLPIYEPSANVVFEALAAGLPVITTRFNGAAEVLEEGINGTVLDDPRDNGAVLRALSYWWSRRKDRPRIQADRFRMDHNVDETLRLLERVSREKLK